MNEKSLYELIQPFVSDWENQLPTEEECCRITDRLCASIIALVRDKGAGWAELTSSAEFLGMGMEEEEEEGRT